MDLSYSNNRSEDEDEDFISPISPLYKYFEQEEFNQVPENLYHESNKQSILNSILNGLRCVRATLADICNIAVVSVYHALCSYHNKVQIQMFNKVFNIVCKKELLIPEDIVFIESFVPNTLYVVEDHFFQLTVPIVSSCAVFGYFVFGNGFETELINNIYKDNLVVNIGKKLMLFAVSFTFSFSGWYFLLYCYHRFKCYCIQNRIAELCTVLNSTISTFRKSFRILQETEMIARGFASASAANVAQRLELSTTLPINSADRQLPEYRKLLFSWIKDIFVTHRNATLELIESWPISTDCMSHYFATLELKEFGNLLKYDVHSAEELVELLNVSDNLSISSLKSLHQLMEVQVSEFLRRYCLSLLTDADPEDVNYFMTFDKLTGIYDLLEKIQVHHSKILAIAKQGYSYYRSVEDSSHSSSHEQFNPSTTSPLHNVGISLHGLNLHLRASLVKTIAIEDYINQEENMSPNETPEEINSRVTTKLNEMLNDVKSELSISNEHILECYSLIEHLERKSTMSHRKGDETPNWQLIEKAFSECNQKLNFIGDSDPVIEDEVYEAITRETEIKNNSKIVEYDYDGKHKVDKVTTAHLMRELKTILVVKAEEHREREQKALEAKASKQKKLDENLSEDKSQDTDLSEKITDITDVIAELESSSSEDVLKTNSNHNGGEAKIESSHNDDGELKTESSLNVDNDFENSYNLHSEMCEDDACDLKKQHIFCDIFQQKTLNFHDVDINDPSSEGSENLPFKSDISDSRDKSDFSVESSVPTPVGLSSLFQNAQHSSFAASIAALAAERQQKLNLQNLTYECDENIIEDDC